MAVRATITLEYSVYFLLSEESSFVNAQILYVDGGYLAVDDIAKYEYEVSKA